MITLYGSGESRSFRVLWALEEAGLKYDYIPVKIGSLENNGTQTKYYKKINFQGKVPALMDDNLVINESAAILNYIAALVPEKNLMPLNDINYRAYYDEICFFVMADLEQPLWTNGKHRFVLPKDKRVEAVLETTHWEFSKSLKALKHYLNGNQFAVGDTFTMADILIAHTLHWAEVFKFKIPPSLLDYKNRLYLRPACQRALKL